MDHRDLALLRRYQSDPSPEPDGGDRLRCHAPIMDDPERHWSGAERVAPLELDVNWLWSRLGGLLVTTGERLVRTGAGLRNAHPAA
ncbi:MAG TPA: hypothetical protein VNF73_15350 [Candidatus Saccharimonadales bacterium]|nr:hypothetical protein [Candidatus Saccharimonadales bacterium]